MVREKQNDFLEKFLRGVLLLILVVLIFHALGVLWPSDPSDEFETGPRSRTFAYLILLLSLLLSPLLLKPKANGKLAWIYRQYHLRAFVKFIPRPIIWIVVGGILVLGSQQAYQWWRDGKIQGWVANVGSNSTIVATQVSSGADAVHDAQHRATTASPSPTGPETASPTELAALSSERVDARGFINVWRLRHELAPIEALETSDDTDQCSTEGDPENPPSEEQSKQLELEQHACAQRTHQAYAVYQDAYRTFNQVWLPLLYDAIQKGDRVAEVVMRQCETTTVLDRSGIESSCDEDPKRKAAAIQRLNEIGFMPAVDISHELAPDWLNPKAHPRQRELNQLAVMKKVRAGGLGFDQGLVRVSGTNSSLRAAYGSDLRKLAHRWAMMKAATEVAPRAFTFSPPTNSADWETVAFEPLRLNRKPLTPGYMTWGRALYYGGSNSPATGYDYWREVGIPNSRPLLDEIESNITRYLSEDSRWSVFLLNRIGHHEWVPEGMKSTTHILDPSFEGAWTLVKETRDWTKPMLPSAGRATIRRNGEYLQMTVTAERPEVPLLNVENCTLRYSGGSTYLPELVAAGQTTQNTLLGYFDVRGPSRAGSFWSDGENKEAVAPFDPKTKYKQVLMQCDNAESTLSSRVRFLLLAGDVLVEFGAARPFGGTLAVQHYHRMK